MPTESRPASPAQVRLLLGLSSLTALPLVAIVMVYFTGHQTAQDQVTAWQAFAIALAAGAGWGLTLVRFVPIFGGTVPSRASVRSVLTVISVGSLIVVVVIGRLAQQAIPATMGFGAGADAVLATVLLIRSLRNLSEIATPPQ